MQTEKYSTIVFILGVTAIVLILATLLVTFLYFYNKKKIIYFENLENLKLDHEKNLLKSQIEVQEQTFQHISREIHDNISLSLTLAKLHLNMLDINHKINASNLIMSAVNLISKSLLDLSDISKSMNSDVISQQGLIDALKNEIKRIQKPGLFSIDTTVKGNAVFMDSKKELVIFRIVQEAFNNIIKHSAATKVKLELFYASDHVEINIEDNGKGFDMDSLKSSVGAGIVNMRTRAQAFNGSIHIKSKPETGTTILILIPF